MTHLELRFYKEAEGEGQVGLKPPWSNKEADVEEQQAQTGRQIVVMLQAGGVSHRAATAGLPEDSAPLLK